MIEDFLPPEALKTRTDHRFMIADWVNKNGWTRGVEVGVLDGQHTFYLLNHCPQLSMIAVDSWRSYKDSSDKGVYWKRINLEAIGREMREDAKQYGDRCTVMHMFSTQAAHLLEGQVFDFVFIDANHSYESVKEDIKMWAPLTKNLMGHDAHKQKVRRAVKEYYPRFKRHPYLVWTAK